jgi:hypothetical protein
MVNAIYGFPRPKATSNGNPGFPRFSSRSRSQFVTTEVAVPW